MMKRISYYYSGDRVRRIRLRMSALTWQKLIMSIDPNTQAPCLRQLALWSAALPIRSPLLMATVGLVTLALRVVATIHFHLTTQLSHTHQLESLMICLHSPLPYGHVERYERLLGRPLCPDQHPSPGPRQVHIISFNRLTFITPHLLQWINTSGNPRFTSTVQIFNALGPLLSVMTQLTLDYEEGDLSSEWHDELDHTRWDQVFGLFNKVQRVDVENGLVGRISHSLRTNDEGPLWGCSPI
ncbi:hypothetical protein BJV78DRAFT_214503 [Lactifluus subvellereus]|nr:hypothetical protein BJV78DRAFT_214503 [Lactifluus subvellereus]